MGDAAEEAGEEEVIASVRKNLIVVGALGLWLATAMAILRLADERQQQSGALFAFAMGVAPGIVFGFHVARSIYEDVDWPWPAVPMILFTILAAPLAIGMLFGAAWVVVFGPR